MHSLSARCIAVVTFALAPLAAHAAIFQFNAQLNAASEVPILANPTAATGVATLFYDNHGTLSLTDDTYDFAMSAFGLTGGTVAGTAASAFHIHGAATTAESAPVRIALDGPLFTNLNAGSTLLVGGNDVAATDIPATPASATNAGHPAMSFLQMLQSQLAYVNVHTALHPGGAIRGQLIEVTAVPEPETYAMLLAGLGFLAFMARRRMR
jgi:CHRD domain/PEP-CTERM motif